MAKLFALENSITSTTGHASYVEQLGTIDHVVVCEKESVKEISPINLFPQNELTLSSSYAHPLRFHLVAKTSFIFP